MTATDSTAPTGASSPTPTAAFSLSGLPPRIAGLSDLANNLAWSWNREARALFREVDESLWNRERHNPIVLLQEVSQERLDALANDPGFLARYDRLLAWLKGEKSDEHTWYARTFPELRGKPIAYFCAEFGVHNSVPIYSGGLGVLAG